MKNNLNKTISQIFESQYIIPLYQRNFAWREVQISRLLKDVYDSFQRNASGNYFIGSLVVRKRRGEDYEVIDGQQRLTVLSLIAKILGISNKPRLSYDSRPNVEAFLNAFYAGKNINELSHPTITYLKEAVDIIKTTNLSDKSEGRECVTIYNDDNTINNEFSQYFANHVILVRVEIPEDTDVASYFEIMNNRGEQLQEHEILKALIISDIKEADSSEHDIEKQKEFSLIWDACSQIDEPIQKVFNTVRRKQYFGNGFDDFCFTRLACGEKAENTGGYTLEKILKNEHKQNKDAHINNDKDEYIEFVDETKYSSIIDFPNFLMHIFKAFYNEEYKKVTDNDVPLDAKFMLKVFDTIKDKIEPEQFIGHLFRSKVFFDRYIIKTIDEDKVEDNISWSLKRVKCYDKKMGFIGTFSEDNLYQERIIKALTMLQVTFSSRKYKNWLQESIRWFAKRDSIIITPKEYINFLDQFILQRYEEDNISSYQIISQDESLTKNNSMSLGVHTPHFLFNFIDYLYWVESKNRIHDIKLSEIVKNFDFKYWNSVEHHLAQHKAQSLDGAEDFVNNLGNLCLLSKSSNSRLSDRDVKEKVMAYASSNMGSNRQIMYAITKAHNYEWDQACIKDHYNNLLDLISKRKEILLD